MSTEKLKQLQSEAVKFLRNLASVNELRLSHKNFSYIFNDLVKILEDMEQRISQLEEIKK